MNPQHPFTSIAVNGPLTTGLSHTKPLPASLTMSKQPSIKEYVDDNIKVGTSMANLGYTFRQNKTCFIRSGSTQTVEMSIYEKKGVLYGIQDDTDDYPDEWIEVYHLEEKI